MRIGQGDDRKFDPQFDYERAGPDPEVDAAAPEVIGLPKDSVACPPAKVQEEGAGPSKPPKRRAQISGLRPSQIFKLGAEGQRI